MCHRPQRRPQKGSEGDLSVQESRQRLSGGDVNSVWSGSRIWSSVVTHDLVAEAT